MTKDQRLTKSAKVERIVGVGGDAVHLDTGSVSQARHDILQSYVSALPLSPIGLSRASRVLEKALEASHRGSLTVDNIKATDFQMPCEMPPLCPGELS